jgi:hypothetical protein
LRAIKTINRRTALGDGLHELARSFGQSHQARLPDPGLTCSKDSHPFLE